MAEFDPVRRYVCPAVCVLAYSLFAPAGSARAQLPGVPVAQSAFIAPGLAVALDGGRGEGRFVPALAGATGVGRLELAAAVGLPGAPAGFSRSGVSGGIRLAGRLVRTPRYGVTAFVGFGGERMRADSQPATASDSVSGSSRPVGGFVQIPVGVSAGVRGLVGARPWAVSVAPMYMYRRWRIADTTHTAGGARVAGVFELAVSPTIGLGVGFEAGLGHSGPAGSPYAGGGAVIGAGISYAFRHAAPR